MPAQDSIATPAAAPDEPDRGSRPAPAQAYATTAAQRADDLHRRAAALLERADALLASSHRRLTRS